MMYLIWAISNDGKNTLIFEPEFRFCSVGELPKLFHENSVSSVEALIERWNTQAFSGAPHTWKYRLVAKS